MLVTQTGTVAQIDPLWVLMWPACSSLSGQGLGQYRGTFPLQGSVSEPAVLRRESHPPPSPTILALEGCWLAIWWSNEHMNKHGRLHMSMACGKKQLPFDYVLGINHYRNHVCEK